MSTVFDGDEAVRVGGHDMGVDVAAVGYVTMSVGLDGTSGCVDDRVRRWLRRKKSSISLTERETERKLGLGTK